jgi:hypothetical protein
MKKKSIISYRKLMFIMAISASPIFVLASCSYKTPPVTFNLSSTTRKIDTSKTYSFECDNLDNVTDILENSYKNVLTDENLRNDILN